jgi:MoaA/NifB/PqqE/SkfB family radical SAM enzyme
VFVADPGHGLIQYSYEGFIENWNISKDEVEICRDCEYRYACTDCRAFTDKKANKYARPSRCNYNPYQGLWKGENGYVDVTKYLK